MRRRDSWRMNVREKKEIDFLPITSNRPWKTTRQNTNHFWKHKQRKKERLLFVWFNQISSLDLSWWLEHKRLSIHLQFFVYVFFSHNLVIENLRQIWNYEAIGDRRRVFFLSLSFALHCLLPFILLLIEHDKRSIHFAYLWKKGGSEKISPHFSLVRSIL